MWHHTLPSSSSSSSRYGLPPELGMFVVAPTTSFHPPNPNPDPLISADGVIPNLWQPQQVQQQTLRTINFDQNPLRSGGGGGGATLTCQDCGNQAKKDCSHGRCRTCCKSRGLDCSTHVKSTWVPAARRRERQMMAAGASSGSNSGAKKQRLSQNTATTNSHTSTSNTPPRSFDTSSSHQADADLKDSFPGQVRAPAVFKCVRVTAVDDGEDEFAYQAVVKIGGHVFKGLLYDQGVDPGDIPNLSDLHLGGGGRNGEGLSSPLMEPLPVYGGGYVGGSSYGNTNN